MKTFFVWMIAGLCVCTSLSAQRGGGRGGAGGGGGNRDFGGGGMGQSQTISRDYDQVQIADFPEIEGLNVNQKLKLFSLVKDEHKNILRLTDEKQALQRSVDRATKQKDIDKGTKDMAKLDTKIQKVSQDSDKKIKSTLDNNQYREFVEKKDQIKFTDPPMPTRGGARPRQ